MIVLLVIIVLILLICFTNIGIQIKTKDEKIHFYLLIDRIFKFKIGEKRIRKPNIHKYNKKYYHKKIEHYFNKSKKTVKEKKEISKSKAESGFENLLKSSKSIIIILKKPLLSFLKHLKIVIYKLQIKYMVNNASDTALCYPVISQLISFLLKFLSNIAHLKVKKTPYLIPSYHEKNISIDTDLRISFTLLFAIKFIIVLLIKYTKYRIKKEISDNG